MAVQNNHNWLIRGIRVVNITIYSRSTISSILARPSKCPFLPPTLANRPISSSLMVLACTSNTGPVKSTEVFNNLWYKLCRLLPKSLRICSFKLVILDPFMSETNCLTRVGTPYLVNLLFLHCHQLSSFDLFQSI